MKVKTNKVNQYTAIVIILLGVVIFFPKTTYAATGSIRVCKVILDSTGKVTTGIAQPFVTFTENFFAPSQFEVNRKACYQDQTIAFDKTYQWCPAAAVPAKATFTTPLNLNTYLPGIPAGPGGGTSNNAQCKTYSNLPIDAGPWKTSDGTSYNVGQYFYKEEVISRGSWEKPLYNDTYSKDISINNFFTYSYYDLDSDPSNNQIGGNAEGLIQLTTIKYAGQVGDPENRSLVILNQEKPIVTPTPKPSATPTKTPSPSPTKSPTPVPTPTPIPSPTPIPPKKDIGKLEGLPLMLTSLSQVNKGTPYWVKITVNGYGGTATVTEKINGSNFSVIAPSYNDPTYGQTFRITQPAAGYEAEIQDTICPSVSCVTAPSVTGFTAALGSIPNGEKRFVYFKVIPTNTASNASIDATGSTVTYSNFGSPVNIPPGGPVVIDASIPFFQIFGGDVWSASPFTNSIISILTSSSQFFANTNDSVIFHLSGADFGVGEVSPKNWQAGQYPKIETFSFNTLHELYKKNIKPQDITGSIVNTEGYYEQVPLNGGKLVLKSSDGWGTNAAPLVVDKKVVIFVDGNLYIDNGVNIQVKKDGKSSLTFIVSGRIGIHPSITDLQGIYLADGLIDTACADQSSAAGNSPCNPDKYDPSASSQLTLEGIFASNAGFNLDRTGVPGSVPGEKFVYRPDMILGSTEVLGREKYSWSENIR